MLEDLKEKFQLKLMYLFAPFTAFFVGPIAGYRYLRGEYLAAVLDAAIVLIVLLAVVYVHLRRSITAAAIVVGVLYTGGAALVSYINGPLYIFWLFPAVLANFFLLHPVLALVVNLIAVVLVIPVALQTSEPILTTGMVGSLLFSICMAFGFARLTERQSIALKTAATLDPLTGVGNRRLMDAEITRSMDKALRHPAPMSLIVLDVDKFKDINDQHGHKRGDRLLMDVANLLVSQTRNGDRVFRFGGEEFVVLAEQTSLEQASVAAEHLRKQIHMRIKVAGQPLTASFGCAQLELGESAERWFGRADRALYKAKEQGRNCVVLAEPSPEAVP